MKNVPVILIAVLSICFVQKTSAQKISRSDVRGVLYVAGIPFTGSFKTFCKIEENCPADADTKRFIVLPNFGVSNSVDSTVSISVYLQEPTNRLWYRVAYLKKQDLDKLGTIVAVISTIEDRVVISGSKNLSITFYKTTITNSISWVQVR